MSPGLILTKQQFAICFKLAVKVRSADNGARLALQQLNHLIYVRHLSYRRMIAVWKGLSVSIDCREGARINFELARV